MKVLYIEPLKAPRPITIDGSLVEMRKLVDGDIACTYPWEDPVGLVHNDNAIAEGKPFNRVLEDYDIIRGSFFLAGLGVDDFTDLSDPLIEKYSSLFAAPEIFIPTPEGLAVIRIVEAPL